MVELEDVPPRAHDIIAGPLEIHYQPLTQLPKSSLLLLSNIVNKIWISGELSWWKAIIIPVPKPSKDPTNYHPIALTSCICKTMEGMVNRRLVWYLYFSFQPVLHDWCQKGRGICYPVCGIVHIK